MKKFILLYLFFCFFVAVKAQNTAGVIGATNDLSQFLNPMQYDGLYVPLKKTGNASEDSKYLFSKWEGDFQMFFIQKKGLSIKNLNYNIDTNKLESKIGKDSLFQFDIDKVDFIKYDSKKYKFYNFNQSNQLYQELYVSSGKIIFLKGYKLIFKDIFVNPMTNAVISEAKYEKKEKYFCKISDNKFVQIDLKKKSIINLLGDKSSQIEKYVSDSKLSYSSEEDLIKILDFYNTL